MRKIKGRIDAGTWIYEIEEGQGKLRDDSTKTEPDRVFSLLTFIWNDLHMK